MTYYVDIDGTICTQDGTDYENAKPIQSAIDRINALYDEGHRIVYWTARGTKTGINWTYLTLKQFDAWGVKFHDLQFGKPAYDVLIDDKAFNISEIGG